MMKREFDVFEWDGDDWQPKRVTVQLPDRVYLSVIDPELFPDRREISDEEAWRFFWWNYDPEPDDIEYVPREELDAAQTWRPVTDDAPAPLERVVMPGPELSGRRYSRLAEHPADGAANLSHANACPTNYCFIMKHRLH